MKAIQFEEVTKTYAEEQPQYLPLPVYHYPDDHMGTVVSCWEFTEDELAALMKSGCLWISQMRFQSDLQPIRPSVEKPFMPPHTVAENWIDLKEEPPPENVRVLFKTLIHGAAHGHRKGNQLFIDMPSDWKPEVVAWTPVEPVEGVAVMIDDPNRGKGHAAD